MANGRTISLILRTCHQETLVVHRQLVLVDPVVSDLERDTAEGRA